MFLLLLLFYPAQCFELGGRKGDQENFELSGKKKIRGQKCQFNPKQRERVDAGDGPFVVPENGNQTEQQLSWSPVTVMLQWSKSQQSLGYPALSLPFLHYRSENLGHEVENLKHLRVLFFSAQLYKNRICSQALHLEDFTLRP